METSPQPSVCHNKDLDHSDGWDLCSDLCSARHLSEASILTIHTMTSCSNVCASVNRLSSIVYFLSVIVAKNTTKSTYYMHFQAYENHSMFLFSNHNCMLGIPQDVQFILCRSWKLCSKPNDMEQLAPYYFVCLFFFFIQISTRVCLYMHSCFHSKLLRNRYYFYVIDVSHS